MKVLQIIDNLGQGGAERLTVLYSNELSKIDGIEIDILTLSNKGNYLADQLTEGVNLYSLDSEKMYSPINIIKMRDFLNKHDYDIIHVHLFPAQYWAALAKKGINKKIPIITTEHAAYNNRRKHILLKPIEKIIYGLFDLIISVSQPVQDELIKWLAAEEKMRSKFKVLENGIDLNTIYEASPINLNKNLGIDFDDDTVFLSMIGRFSKQKNHSDLLAAMNLLPDNYQLLLIGVGDIEQEVKDYAKDLGVSNRVHFLGFRDDIPRLLKSIDLLILSSNYEGLSTVLIEGMAAGLPVIGSNIMGINNVIQDSRFLFENGKPEELAELILSMTKDSNLRSDAINHSMDRAKSFDLSNYLATIIDIYINVTDNSNYSG